MRVVKEVMVREILVILYCILHTRAYEHYCNDSQTQNSMKLLSTQDGDPRTYIIKCICAA